MGVLRFILGAILGLIVLASLGSAAQTLVVLAEIGRAAPLSPSDAARAIGRDLLGFAPLYATLLAAPYLLLTGAAALTARWLNAWRNTLFALAGAAAPIVALAAGEAILGASPVHGASDAAGLALQAGAGALAGYAAALASAAPLRR